mmetsp:Transcript_108090/g.305630  ORF Transcript_108090/g.305630 Transcript_108090/m.305630 type:complete len:111 (-) Transcript_108090:335-667(-)
MLQRCMASFPGEFTSRRPGQNEQASPCFFWRFFLRLSRVSLQLMMPAEGFNCTRSSSGTPAAGLDAVGWSSGSPRQQLFLFLRCFAIASSRSKIDIVKDVSGSLSEISTK